MNRFENVIAKIKQMYGKERDFIPLHEPLFIGNEKKYLMDCIDSTFVSSVGVYVNEFEKKIVELTGVKHAIAVVNGTAALHLSLIVAGVEKDDIVVSQSLSFVATANAIKYTGATPYFIDIDRENLGLSVESLKSFLSNVEMVKGKAIHIPTRKKVGAVVPMHTFGFPVKIDEIVELCSRYDIPVIEDAAESLGSSYKGKHTGTFGLLGTYSFNGNKTITSGGGGIIVTNDDKIAKLTKHLSTQSKMPHKWEYRHDMLGYNYRCPNLNAALACAQLEQLDKFIQNKRETAKEYAQFFATTQIQHIQEQENSVSNYWLNAILLESEDDRNTFLKETNENGVMTRPVWTLLHRLDFLSDALSDNLENSIFIEKHLVNIPSSVRL
tara:strand:+ start:22170 stop:23315 length:1146 start_codon:yes stop_codon:yes gene_type:complete